MNSLLTIYLRHEPARDGTKGKTDVVAFSDRDGKPDFTTPEAVWSWGMKRPHRGTKRVMINCFAWKPVWLNHAGKVEAN